MEISSIRKLFKRIFKTMSALSKLGKFMKHGQDCVFGTRARRRTEVASRLPPGGATGTQGRYVTRELLKTGHTVHAIVRDPGSTAARAVRKAGANVFVGDFDSVESMVVAARSCTYAFINVSPVFGRPRAEAEHGQNIVQACRKAGVKKLVLSSVPSLEKLERGELRGLDPENPTLEYRYSKITVQRSVVQAEFESWTILQVPRLLSTFVNPLARLMFPKLATNAVIRTAIDPDLRQSVVDPLDIGRAVAAILEASGGEYTNKKLKLAGAQLTFPEVIKMMNEVLGDESVHLEQISEEEIEETKSTNLIVGSEVFVNQNPEMVVVDEPYDFGFVMGSAKEYFTRERALLTSSVGIA